MDTFIYHKNNDCKCEENYSGDSFGNCLTIEENIQTCYSFMNQLNETSSEKFVINIDTLKYNEIKSLNIKKEDIVYSYNDCSNVVFIQTMASYGVWLKISTNNVIKNGAESFFISALFWLINFKFIDYKLRI